MTDLIVGIGEILWDIYPHKKILGGAPANFAYHCSQLGLNSLIISSVGKDLDGQEIIKALNGKQLNFLIDENDHETGTVEVALDDNGVPLYKIKDKVAWDYIPFTPEMEEISGRTRALCFGTLSQRSEISCNSIMSFINAMPENTFKILDINLRKGNYSEKIIENSLLMCDMLKVNEEELNIISLDLMLNQNNEKDLCRYLLKKYDIKVIALTKGLHGSFVFTNEEESYLPTPKIKVADTVGAGDAFTSAFATSYINGGNIRESHELAVEIASFVCLYYGAMPGLADSYFNIFR